MVQESLLMNETHYILRYFEIKINLIISTRRPDLQIINKKKRTCRILDFVVPVDQGVKIKAIERRDKYIILAKELRKLWNMKVTVTPIAAGALLTLRKYVEKGLGKLRFGP